MTTKLIKVKAIPGRPLAELIYGNVWIVSQMTQTPFTAQLYGPIRKTEIGAILGWNKLARKLNGEKE